MFHNVIDEFKYSCFVYDVWLRIVRCSINVYSECFNLLTGTL